MRRLALKVAGVIALALVGYTSAPLLAGFAWSEWSAPDAFTTDTAATASEADPFLPSTWTDTVHYYDFSGAANTDITNWVGDQLGFEGFTWVIRDGGGCSGGVLSGFQTDCRWLDSLPTAITNQPDNTWWESAYQANAANKLYYRLDSDDGNGPGAASGLTRYYVRLTIVHGNSSTWGANTYAWTDSHKTFSINGIGNFIDVATQGTWAYRGDNSGVGYAPPGGCPDWYANTWKDYFPSDTVNPRATFCVAQGRNMFRTGVVQHLWMCIDMSLPSGQRVLSYGIVTPATGLTGIAAYWPYLTTFLGSNTINEMRWNGTYGGTKSPVPLNAWHGELLIMTGSSGSCLVPPSFS